MPPQRPVAALRCPPSAPEASDAAGPRAQGPGQQTAEQAKAGREDATRPGTTVLVVAYRHADFVVECLESIRAQTQAPARVLVADDCSPDGTAETIRAYARRHPEFLEFRPHAENIGLNRTLNQLVAETDTEFLTYIAADDTMEPERLAVQSAALRADPAAVLAYSDAYVMDRDSARRPELSSAEFPWPAEDGDRTWARAALLETTWIPAASIFLRTAVLRQAGGYREDIFYEDYELLTRLSARGPFAWTPRPLVSVRRLEDSLGATGFAHDSPRFIRALDAALATYEDAPPALRATARAKRWELAKRAVTARAAEGMVPYREAGAMLWRARRGASSPLAFLRHGLRWAARPLAQSSRS